MQQTHRKAVGVNAGACKHPGCQRQAWCKQWCQLHYFRNRNGTDMDAALPTKNRGSQCRVGWCTKPAMSRELCMMHYARSLRGGDMEKPPTLRNKGKHCSVGGCEKESDSRGLCRMHYTRMLRHGDPLVVKPRPSLAGSSSPTWKGDEVGYFAVHGRLKSLRGSASFFECRCGNRARHWALNTERAQTIFVGPDNLAFSKNLWDYDPLCVPCHKRGDLARGSVKDAADAQEGKRRRRTP